MGKKQVKQKGEITMETINDIVAEMRRDCRARHMDGTMYREEDWVYTKGTAKKLADRIEAAWKREQEAGAAAAQICGEIGEIVGREATTEKSSAVGNANAVRGIAQEMLNTSMQEITAERINEWATRLAAACEQPVTDCNQSRPHGKRIDCISKCRVIAEE